MKLTLSILFLVLSLYPSALLAQPETFDILTYTPPSDWTKEAKDFAVSFSTVDQSAGTWCRITVFKSVAGSGNATGDFSAEWKAIVGQTYEGAVEPVPTTQQAGAWWTLNVGTSKFKWQGKEAMLVLITASDSGNKMSLLFQANSDVYADDIDKFITSLYFEQPEERLVLSPQQVAPQDQQSTQATKSAAATIVVTDAAGMSGIITSTTNFDDGWVAQPFADYVRVTKQPITVLLHYAFAVDDEMRYNDMTSVVWNRLIVPRYRTSNLRVFQNEQFAYNKTYFMEGDALEVSTGKSCYVGLRILVSNGIARCIEIISPSMAAYQKEFPNQEKVESMGNYNKFAVTAGDIPGTWEESSSSGIDMYNTVTGSYAGMNMTASAHSFVFKGDGTYSSNHKGAYGMVGSTKFYDQKYNGKLTVSPWELTMTNRFEGKTDVFLCQYEAVRGGRVLHLTDKTAEGIRYGLVRVK
jgi:hypothetical protein